MAEKDTKKEKESLDELEVEEDEELERGNWSGKFDFLLSCLGYAVGLGNVWRFPYLCYKYGGGAFLIPHTIMLFIIGIPCFFLEISLGQYAALGPVTIYTSWAPLFKGLGFANFFASCFVGIYYNMILAWTIYYTFASFTSHLPWSDCSNDFNSEFCFSINEFKNCSFLRANDSTFANAIYHQGKCINEPQELNIIRGNLSHYYSCKQSVEKIIDGMNKTVKVPGVFINPVDCVDPSRVNEIKTLFDIPSAIRKTAAQEYLTKNVLNESDGIEDMGQIQWQLALCLLAAWIVVFFCLIKGIKSSGKVVYFTAIFPYVVLLILLIRAVTLPGAYEGLKFYLIPDWSTLASIDVWEAAAIQIFYSLSVAGGGLITLASYNPFHNNVLVDTALICFANAFTSMFAGFCIFSVLGFLATELGVPVGDVVQSGTGLAFVAYPDLVTRLPISPLWAILFFLMLFTLGIDSQFAIVETVLTGILDFKPTLRPRKTLVVALICLTGFILGLPLTTQGGGYILDLLDYYAAGWPYLFIGLMELIILAYIYGLQNFYDDLYHIFKFNPGTCVKSHITVLYMSISPIVIGIILVISWAKYEPLTRGDYYVFPTWANTIGWVIAMTAILSVPAVAFYQIIQKLFWEYAELDWNEKYERTCNDLLRPTSEWRKNAGRARRRQIKADKAEVEIGASSDSCAKVNGANGAKAGEINSGFDDNGNSSCDTTKF